MWLFHYIFIFRGTVYINIMADYPQWVLAQKKPGTEIRKIRDFYYLYEAKCVYDKDKKRGKKVTGKYLGRITEKDGLVPPRQKKSSGSVGRIEYDKEYGVVALYNLVMPEYSGLLKKHFPEDWQSILAMSYCRLVKQSPMKMMDFHYSGSYMSETFTEARMSGDSLTALVRKVGIKRESIVGFCREFSRMGGNVIFDGSDMVSASKKMDLPKFSKAKPGNYDTLINLMFVYSVDAQIPVYYRILPGSIKDVKSFMLSFKESGINDATAVIDKGFCSRKNIEMLDSVGMKFIVPLKRSDADIDYTPLNAGGISGMEGHFTFEGRNVWYYSREVDGKPVYVYLDTHLRERESDDFLRRIEANEAKSEDKRNDLYTEEAYRERYVTFGTLALLTNSGKSPKDVYVDYKSRCNVEQMIDTFKNVLEDDRRYMQDELALEGWMFVNYIALHWYYKIYQRLAKSGLISRYSVMDIIEFLQEIRKIKIDGVWYTKEATAKTAKVLKALDLKIS